MPNWNEPDFDWDDANIEHLIDRHGIYPEEAEEVFYNGPYVRREGAYHYVYGKDDSGRYLRLVCVLRQGFVRVISARPMERRERRYYERHH